MLRRIKKNLRFIIVCVSQVLMTSILAKSESVLWNKVFILLLFVIFKTLFTLDKSFLCLFILSIFIFFLVFLSMISPSQQTFDHGKDDHNPTNCDHLSNFTTNGYLVFKVSSKGCRDFTKVQDAIDAITPSRQVKNLILIDFGIYM